MAGCFPEELSFLWVEPQMMKGLEILTAVRKTIWKAVRIINKNPPACEGTIESLSIYSIQPPDTTV
jgi:hypothetical protein